MRSPRLSLRGYLAAIALMAGFLAPPCVWRWERRDHVRYWVGDIHDDPIALAGLGIAVVGLGIWYARRALKGEIGQ